MSKRALRRHHRERMFRHCARILKFRWDESLATGDLTLDDLQRWAMYRRDNFTICSCWMCCNPRRLRNGNGPERTIQELRSQEDFEQQLAEVSHVE